MYMYMYMHVALAGAQQAHLRLHPLPPAKAQLSHRPRREAGSPPAAAQHSLGHDMPGRNTRGTHGHVTTAS